MDMEKRFDEVSAMMDELRAKTEKAHQEIKGSFSDGVANFKADMEFTSKSIDEIADDAERKHDLRVEKRIDDVISASESIRDKINSLAQERSRAEQEAVILDLLDYAEECQGVAAYMADEAVMAYRAAAGQLAEYKKKYGK